MFDGIWGLIKLGGLLVFVMLVGAGLEGCKSILGG